MKYIISSLVLMTAVMTAFANAPITVNNICDWSTGIDFQVWGDPIHGGINCFFASPDGPASVPPNGNHTFRTKDGCNVYSLTGLVPIYGVSPGANVTISIDPTNNQNCICVSGCN